jgi:aminoglycoside 6'-N-acetyltransferase
MSQIYLELDRLSAAGMVATTETKRSAREARRYELTDAGRDEIRRWLCHDALAPTVFKSHLALRTVVGHLGDPAVAVADIETERRRVRAALDDLDVVLDALEPLDPRLGWAWLVASWGDRYYRDAVAQLDELRELLEDPAARRPTARDTRVDGDTISLVPVHPDHHARLRALHRHPVIAAAWGEPAPSWPDDPSVHAYAIIGVPATAAGGDEEDVVGFVQWAEERDAQYRHAGIDLFVDPSRHRRGIGTAAVRLLVDHLVADRGHHRIVIDPAADNVAAIACYRRAGFREVGVMRAYERGADGRFHDGLLMEYVQVDEGGSA